MNNELVMKARVYWKTKKNNWKDAWCELCDMLMKYEIGLDIVILDDAVELRDENGMKIEE